MVDCGRNRASGWLAPAEAAAVKAGIETAEMGREVVGGGGEVFSPHFDLGGLLSIC